MVATRHSLPLTFPSSSPPPSPSHLTKKQLAALKKLRIDAKDALLGRDPTGSAAASSSSSSATGRVYHYRGTTYEVTGQEPEEWLRQEPERYKRKRWREIKREREGEGGYEEGGEEGEGEIGGRILAEDARRGVAALLKKRRRRQSEPLARASRAAATRPLAGNSNFRIAADDDMDVDSNIIISHGSPRRRHLRSDPRNNMFLPATSHRLAYDYPLDGGREPQTCAEARLVRPDLQVSPLPARLIEENTAHAISRQVVQMARLNSEVHRLVEEYNACVERI
ncbi:MAG: hypothetical protein FE78DRAFT_263597, partial [Acidomyces sp. 'richmondensis']